LETKRGRGGGTHETNASCEQSRAAGDVWARDQLLAADGAVRFEVTVARLARTSNVAGSEYGLFGPAGIDLMWAASRGKPLSGPHRSSTPSALILFQSKIPLK
jgi:hypothetical protein